MHMKFHNNFVIISNCTVNCNIMPVLKIHCLQHVHYEGPVIIQEADALHLASSAAYPNQAFFFRDSVLALQFHFEMDLPAIKDIIRNSGDEMVVSAYVQRVDEMLEHKHHIVNNNELMRKILDRLEHTS